MPVITDRFELNMEDIEKRLKKVDFSKYTDFKTILAERLFQQKDSAGKTGPMQLSDEDAEFISAARGITNKDPWEDKY